jgi:autotransporter-associated beta strand protein
LDVGAGSVAIGNNNASTTYTGALGGAGALIKTGAGTLTLVGTNTYTGSTTVSGGTLALTGTGSVASPTIIVSGGATFDVSALTTPFALGGRTLTNNSVGAVLKGNNDCSSGSLSLVADGVNPAFIQTNGTMTISAGTIITVNNIGAPLATGHHPLITAVTMGSPGQVTGVLPPVTVTGNGADGAASLQVNGMGGLDLVVASTIATNPTNISYTVSGGVLTLSWPGNHLGWIAQSNAVNIASSNFWFDIVGSQSATNLVILINPADTNMFYRLRYPN